MVCICSIKLEFWISEQVVECLLNVCFMFIGFMNFVDDNGVYFVKLMWIKMQVFFGDVFNVLEISSFISELESVGLICCYEVDGEVYL